MKTAVLFDMDGVTLDTEPLYTKAEIKLFAEYEVEIPPNDWALFRGCSEEDFYDLSMKRYNICENKSLFMEKGREYIKNEFKNNLTFMPGFHSLIRRITPLHKIGLVTASPLHNVQWLCKLIPLNKIFEHIITGSESKRNKPYPDPYTEMMKILNVLPQNTVIIEDSLYGIRSGLASGAHVIAKTGSIPKHDLNIAHHIIHHLDEITDALLEELLLKSL